MRIEDVKAYEIVEDRQIKELNTRALSNKLMIKKNGHAYNR